MKHTDVLHIKAVTLIVYDSVNWVKMSVKALGLWWNIVCTPLSTGHRGRGGGGGASIQNFKKLGTWQDLRMFFSVITKNLNWEISTKNLVTFKRWDGMGFIRENWLKRGAWQFADLRGGLLKKRGFIFLRGLDTPMHIM